MITRRTLFTAVAGLATSAIASLAWSDQWSQRPVKVVVPFAAGGNTDGITRLAGQRLSEKLGQPFVIQNIGGAGGTIAATTVARAPADGYTLLMAATPQIAIVPAMMKVSYDPVKDFAPISVVGTNGFVLAVNKNIPLKTVAEFIAWVKAQPGKLSYAEGGLGSVSHLSKALFLKRAGIDMTHVSYRRNALALTDVIAGNLPAIFLNLSEGMPHVNSGANRIPAVLGETRAQQIADVPTVAETGYPGYKALSWNGLVAPTNTLKPITDRIAGEIALADKDPTFVELLSSFGFDHLGKTPERFAALIASDLKLRVDAVAIAGITSQ